MIEYVSISTGVVLDRVRLDGETFSYETGKARSLVENRTALGQAPEQVMADLADWSNGYVLTRQRPWPHAVS